VPGGEFGVRFRGWKLPRELSEDVGPDTRGVNPFTKEAVIFQGHRSPVGPEPVADRDAIPRPRVHDLPALELPEDIYDQTLDALARVVFGWTARYATGEISRRYLEGGEGRNDWFVLVPQRVVDAVAALLDAVLPSTAREWSEAAFELPPEVAAAWLPRIHAFCRGVPEGALVLLWGTR